MGIIIYYRRKLDKHTFASRFGLIYLIVLFLFTCAFTFQFTALLLLEIGIRKGTKERYAIVTEYCDNCTRKNPGIKYKFIIKGREYTHTNFYGKNAWHAVPERVLKEKPIRVKIIYSPSDPWNNRLKHHTPDFAKLDIYIFGALTPILIAFFFWGLYLRYLGLKTPATSSDS